MQRRNFLKLAAVAPAAPFLGAVAPGEGLVVPEGFTVREIAISGEVVAGTEYVWHTFPDGGATFPTPGEGWIYVSNSEVPTTGGVGAIEFDSTGAIVDAYRILDGTSINCAGGATPWGTWLSCEEYADGQVWECDPFGQEEAVVRPALGIFKHEAVAVDPDERALYLTQDDDPGHLYRFTPVEWEDLSAGVLEVALEAPDGSVAWSVNVDEGTNYAGGEGIAYQNGVVVFTTKSDGRIRELDVAAQTVRVLSEGFATGPDNVIFSAAGDLYVCEDTPADQDLVLIDPDGTPSSFARLTNAGASEFAGVAFDPSGRRMYVSSQRGAGGAGITYEITGPFRRPATPESSTTAPTPTIPPDPPDDSGSTGVVIGGGAAAAVVVVGGAIWLRRRRTTGTPDR